MFKTRFISILALLLMAVSGAWATITVTWNNDDLTGSGKSFTKDGVTITAGSIDFGSKNFMGGGTFTTTLGNFTKIEVTTGSWHASGTGWSGSRQSGTWAGTPASSVSFSGDISGMGMGNTKFVFTIEPATVAVTGVTLAPTSATLTLGETETVTLIPTVLPGDATDKSVTWSSSDETVATVTDGVVTAVAAGTATITVTTTDGAKTATCAVTVAAPAASTYTVTLKEGTEDATSWTIAPAEATTTGVEAGTEVKATYGGMKKVKSVKAKKAAPAEPEPVEPTLANTLTNAGMTVKVMYNYSGDGDDVRESSCSFLSKGGGNYDFVEGSGWSGGDSRCAKALVVEDDKLVFKLNMYEDFNDMWDAYGFSVTFDTGNNTYIQWKGSDVRKNSSLISVEVNNQPINNSLTERKITVDDLDTEGCEDWEQIVEKNPDLICADDDDFIRRMTDNAKLMASEDGGNSWYEVLWNDSWEPDFTYKFEVVDETGD